MKTYIGLLIIIMICVRPPSPPPPQVVEIIQVDTPDMERPPMTPRQMAATVAAIMTAVPTASPSAVVDRLCNTMGGVVPEPQRAAIDFSVGVALELMRELCEHLFRRSGVVRPVGPPGRPHCSCLPPLSAGDVNRLAPPSVTS